VVPAPGHSAPVRAVGKYGSLAVIERSMRTLKSECTRRLILVPYRLARFEQELEQRPPTAFLAERRYPG